MNITQKLTEYAGKPRILAILSLIILSIGIVAGIWINAVAVPHMTASLKDLFAEPVVYTAVKVYPPTPPDRVERYYTEEYEALGEKYEQARKDEALLRAMERVELEFETEKEEIRERQLFQ